MINRNLKQDVTYWSGARETGFGGFTFQAPVALKGRWQDKQMLFTDREGAEKRSTAVVYLGTDVDFNGFLYLGTSTETDPTTLDGAWAIQQVEKIPDLRNLESLRKIYL